MATKGQKRDGRNSDLELNWLTKQYGSEWEEWRSLGEQWLKQQHQGLGKKRTGLTLFFETYLLAFLPWASSPCVFFEGYQEHQCSSENFKAAILQTTHRSDEGTLSITINYVVDFLDWILDTRFCEPNDHGIHIRFWQNPFQKIKQKSKLTESVRNPLPYKFIQDLQKILCPKFDGCFQDWQWAQQHLDRDWFEVKPDLIDKNDPDCVWRTKEVLRKIKGVRKQKITIYQLWSPVRAMVLFIKLHLPLRSYQVRMLDSGEADTWRYQDGQWFENTIHPFALNNSKRPYEKGVFRRIYDSMTGTYGTGLYINSNKTADRNKSEQDKGYVIPWENREVLYWCQKLRNWQEKFNPICKPTNCCTLLTKHTGDLKSDQQLSDMGSLCFLFRDAAAKGEDRIKPLVKNKTELLWYLLLKTLEDEVAQSDMLNNDQPLKLVYDYPDDRNVSKKTATFFPLHSLRVSLITAYVLDGKVPLPVISKLLAGHSRLLMTLYYIRINPSTMSQKMKEAHQNLEASEEQSLYEFLQNASLSQIQEKVVYHDSNSFKAALETRNPVGWIDLHHGFCLMGANTSAGKR